jgi:DNA polymerase-3 subunit beta
MDFTIAREELLRGLYLTQGIVERRTTIPILANVLLESGAEGIVLSATDNEVGVRRRCVAKVKKKGSVTTGARKLYEIVRECPEGDLRITALENSWIEVSAAKSRFKIVGIDPKEFPSMPAPQDSDRRQVLPGALLKEMIDHTSFAVSTDETRQNLSGILMESHEAEKLRFVATDGHRLAMITRAVKGAGKKSGVILPRKGIAELAKVLEEGDDEVAIGVEGSVAHASRGPVDLSMRLVEGEFPDYQQVVPQ